MSDDPTYHGHPADETLQVFAFDHDHGVPARTLPELLGGKGAGLAEMTTALGLPVPPGFTIAIPVYREYVTDGWPSGLTEAIESQCAELGRRLGRRFGDPDDPLLLAVRSGAASSMPGMLDTVLNLGITSRSVHGLARASGDERFAWDCYRRFLLMYATTVLGCAPDDLGGGEPFTNIDGLRTETERLRAAIRSACGQDVPDEPAQQLRAAVEAVFRSCGSERARAYAAHEGMTGEPGTAVNVQAMVFGNRGSGNDSGTGVVFTRDPSTGEPVRYGDYLCMAQGEDVVAGGARTSPISTLAEQLPAVWSELDGILGRLERHYADICDVEFTVEEGRLWILQTRVGKRGAVAAVRAAVHMAEDPEMPLSREQAVARVGEEVRDAARAAVLEGSGRGSDQPVIARGLGASPGVVTGRAVFSSAAAMDADEADAVVLIRPTTSPDDVPGMSVAAGVITARGGLVSHAAVVARGWGLPAVVGAEDLVVDEFGARTSDGSHQILPGDLVTLDGTTGEIRLGAHVTDKDEATDPEQTLRDRLPELLRLEQWEHDS
jgi:pyruvate,orthophosphate dikinase